MALYRDPETGEIKSDTVTNQRGALDQMNGQGPSLDRLTGGPINPQPQQQPQQPQQNQGLLGSILAPEEDDTAVTRFAKGAGRFVGDVAADFARVPAAPFATFSESVGQLTGSETLQDNPLTDFVFEGTDPGTLERVGREAKTAAAGGELALMLSSFGTASAAKQGGQSVLKTIAKDTFRPSRAIPDTALGGLFGVGQELQARGSDATPGGMAISGGIGAGLGFATPPILGGAVTGARAGSRAVGRALDDTILEPLSNRYSQRIAELESLPTSQRKASSVKLEQQQLRQRRDIVEGIRRLPDTLVRELTDDQRPLSIIDRVRGLADEMTGARDEFQQSSARAATRTEEELGRLTDILEGDEFARRAEQAGLERGEFLDVVSADLRLRNISDQLRRDQLVEDGIVERDVVEALNDLRRRVGVEQFDELVGQTSREVRQLLDENLDYLVSREVIPREAAQRFRRANPNYIPNEYAEFLEGNLRRGATGGTGGISALQRRGGSERTTLDAFQSIARLTRQSSRAGESNIATLRTLGRAVEENPEIARREGIEVIESAANNREKAKLTNKIKRSSDRTEQLLDQVKTRKGEIKDIESTIDGQVNDLEQINKEVSELRFELSRVKKDAPEMDVGRAQNELNQLYRNLNQAEEQFSRQINTIAESARDRAQPSALLKSVQENLARRDEALGAMRRRLVQLKKKAQSAPKVTSVQAEGKDIVTYKRGGFQERVAVPADLADVFNNYDPSGWGAINEFIEGGPLRRLLLRGPATAVRELAVGLNPEFALVTNPIRDLQSAAVQTQSNFPSLAKTYIKAVAANFARIVAPDSSLGQFGNKLNRMAMSNGVGFSGIFDEEKFARKIFERANNDASPFWLVSKPLELIKKPTELIEKTGRFMENSTRQAIFWRTLKDTGDLQFAVKMGREGTVDFQRGGRAIKALNKIFPFLNARVQGTANIFRAFERDPVGTGQRLVHTVVYPAMYLNQHNHQFESYENIPRWEKRNYWIIMNSEIEGQDRNGEEVMIPQYIKIPKGEYSKALAAVVDRSLAIGRAENPESTGDFLKRLAKDVSPVSTSQLLPTFAQYPAELMANYSFFRERQISPDYVLTDDGEWRQREDVPPGERRTYSTSEIAKALGRVTGWDANKVDYILKTGVLSDVIRGTDAILEDTDKIESGPLEQTAWQKFSEEPLIGSVLGSSFYGQDIIEKELETREAQQEVQEELNRFRQRQREGVQQNQATEPLPGLTSPATGDGLLNQINRNQ